MKKSHCVLALTLALFLASCAGGKPTKTVPRHLTEGAKQIKMGLGWYQKGCYSRSLEYFFRAYELYSASDVLDGVAMSLNNIGTIYRILGNQGKAITFFDEAHSIYLELNDKKGAATALSSKAAAFIHMGKLDTAEDVIQEAWLLTSGHNDQRLFVSLLQNKGVLLTKKGKYKEAQKALSDCFNRSGGIDPSQIASLHSAFGNLMLQADRPADAVKSFQKALSVDREIGFYEGMADDLFLMGQAYIKLGHKQEAARSWKRSVKIFAIMDQAGKVRETMKHLKLVAQEAGMDIAVTEAFVESWRQGRLYESPCEQ